MRVLCIILNMHLMLIAWRLQQDLSNMFICHHTEFFFIHIVINIVTQFVYLLYTSAMLFLHALPNISLCCNLQKLNDHWLI